MNHCDNILAVEWRLSSENLTTNPAPFSGLSGEATDFTLTSQARTLNAYISLAVVAPVSDGWASINSGAAPGNNRSTSSPNMVSDGMKAVAKPAIWARSSLPTRTLVWSDVRAWSRSPSEDRTHGFKIPVDETEAVHISQTTGYS